MIANSLITVSLLHQKPLYNEEVFTITLYFKNDFEKYSLAENGWNINFTHDTKICILNYFNYMSKFEILHPNREYWGLYDPKKY